MTRPLSEDDIYRTSSQYRLWSFSPESLAGVRGATHGLALDRARNHAGARQAQHGSNGSSTVQVNATTLDGDPEYLTAEEELRLVQRYCDQVRTTSDHFKWPVNVKATAVQFLKRFYLSNSCMTYPPKEIYKTVLFLACKTEATHMTLSEYARRISTDPQLILAPEYKVMQALRFTLDVRQPFRGLKGVLMELLNLAEGRAGDDVKEEMESLHAPRQEDRTAWNPTGSGSGDAEQLQVRIQAAYSAARALLDAPALLTDVYFLYTPSQILLAAFHLADEPLASFYISHFKLPASSPLRPKILATIHACAEILASFNSSQVLTKNERAEIEEKLELCRDPSTRDMVKSLQAARQDGDDGAEAKEEKAQKKRSDREKFQKESEGLFGPGLTTG